MPPPLLQPIDATRRRPLARRCRSPARHGVPARSAVPTYSIIIPVFNEQESLPELILRLDALVLRLEGPSEVILVDDGSRDGSAALIRAYARSRPHLSLIRLSRNFGHQAALTAGYDAAQGRAVICMDADLQDPPEVVDRLVERWRLGFEVVYAVRTRRHGEGLFKKATAFVFYRLLAVLTGLEIPVDCGDFRLLDRQALDALGRLREHQRYLRGLVAWIGFRQCVVAYERPARAAGTTKYTWRRMLRLAADALVSCSHLPLLLVGAAGLALCCGSLLAAISAALWHGHGHACPSWTVSFILAGTMAGVQLVVLGIVCAYIGRIHEEVRQRPLYVLRDAEPRSAGGGPMRANGRCEAARGVHPRMVVR